ncbi:ribonuclease H-like protein [Polyporus arcularius HHB13444]|uniref:ribonuclease H n=1 Tax=Polyporus arcularius HHB13444 TaxID=1314778 RepID=A0A5C3PGQ9_9APHY|nr:ribonuclease H-like protein [Polyporus arcularius HHB13444]
MDLEDDGTSQVIATDGSCIQNGESRARAGAGVYYENDHRRNLSIRLSDELEQSNQTAEIVATLLATTTAESRTRITIETDSRTTMDSLTKWRQRHEDTGYIAQKNADLTRATIASMRQRGGHTLFRWVKGHNGHARNEEADKLAALGAMETTSTPIRRLFPDTLKVTGAKLQSMTQKLAYQAICARKTVANLDRIVSGVKEAFGLHVHDATVWNSFRTRHVSRLISQFLWMAVHDGYMIGSHWLRPKMPPDLQDRAVCAICGELETMTHITLECEATGRETIWKLLQEVWTHTGARWHEPCWGTTFGAACAVFRNADGAQSAALEQLWCILSTEALHLIWRLRCERVIQNEGRNFTESEVANRFYAAMDARLDLDRRTAAIAHGRKALRQKDVERIWLPVIGNDKELPPKWVVDSGILVGIKRGK